jgi:hypothetical protein
MIDSVMFFFDKLLPQKVSAVPLLVHDLFLWNIITLYTYEHVRIQEITFWKHLVRPKPDDFTWPSRATCYLIGGVIQMDTYTHYIYTWCTVTCIKCTFEKFEIRHNREDLDRTCNPCNHYTGVHAASRRHSNLSWDLERQ